MVSVDQLPSPHHLFRCPFAREHKRCVAAVGESSAGLAVAFDRFAAAVAPRTWQCDYHHADWETATAAAIAALDDAAPWASSRALASVAAEIAGARGGDEMTMWMAHSLFADPIFLMRSDLPALGNGQHRVCAMKIAGVMRCVIDS